MTDTTRTVLYIESDAAEMLAQLAAGRNKRGEYVSDLIRAAWQTKQHPPPAAPADPAGPVKREVFQTATELTVLVNHLLELSEQPTRAILQKVDG